MTPDETEPTTSRQATETGLRTAGTLLALGALVWVAALAFHPPPPPELDAFMALIAETGTRWVVVHWAAAIALSLFIVTSLVVLTARTRLTRTGPGLAAWAVLPVAALWVLTTAIAEATVISQAAVAGDAATFEAWHHFAEGKGMGFMPIAIAVALIAAREARTAQAATPAWAAWIGATAGFLGAAGWILGPVLGFAIGGPLFVLSSIVFGLWLLWFGIGLARSATVSNRAAGTARRATDAPPTR